MDELKNKVDSSGLLTIDLSDFYPSGERTLFDVKPLLIEEFLLREKDFREFVQNHNWENYRGQFVAVTCSNDAVIPVWAYMLISSALEPFANKIFFGTVEEMEKAIFSEALSKINAESFIDKKVVIKGCGDIPVPVSAYVDLTRILKPVVKSIMYGEPCSTVPVFKRK